MPGKGRTTEFPRKDNIYKHKESLPFDEAHSLVWVNRPYNKTSEDIKEWFAYSLIGLIVGTVTFIMKIMEEKLLEFGLHSMDKYTEDDEGNSHFVTPWLVYAFIAATWGFLGGLMTTYYGPAANGSGVAEVIGYLNGVNYPGFMQINTLLTKIIGVTFAVCAKLCVGKEGPLAHIGAIIGVCVIYLPFGFEHLQNDETKRLFVAAGASTGVSCAFGAPIGGALFCYELSKPNTFWKFHMIWKVFFSCCLGTFTLAAFSGIASGNFNDWSGAEIKFGVSNIEDVNIRRNVNVLSVLPNAIILGIEGGLLGALFINVNSRVNILRSKLLKSKWMKPIETAFFGFLSASVFIALPYLFKDHCFNMNLEEYEKNEHLYQTGWCPQPENPEEISINHFASINWASEGDIIKSIISSENF